MILTPTLTLEKPALERLPQYQAALERGWSPDNLRLAVAAREEMAKIAEDAPAFIASLDDPEGRGAPITLPDGSQVKRLPGTRRWLIDDGRFCGNLNFRWQPGTAALPDHVLGHLGYSVPEWEQRKGYATRALAMFLPEIWQLGLAYIEATTDADNRGSQKVLEANGARLLGYKVTGSAYGGATKQLYRIDRP